MGVDGDAASILCVDDTPGLAELTATYVERFDETVTARTATSAREGLAVLETEPIDCIVSDYEMPGMDGLMFLQVVRADDPDLPFILMTGRGSESIASAAISAGVTDYMQKDTGTAQYERLAKRVRTAVVQYRARTVARELQDRTDRVLERSPDPIVVSIDDTLVYANDAAIELFGADAERAVLDQAIETYVHESDRGTAASAFEHVTSGDRTVEHVDRLVLDLDGDSHPVTMTVRRIDWGGETGVVAVMHDRVDQDAERRLQARYQGAFEEGFDAMVLADDDGTYIEANRSACTLLELDKDELIGRSIDDFTPDEHDFAADWASFENASTDRGTIPIVTARGTEKTVEYAATRDIVPGEHLAVLRDVTDRETYVEEIERQRTRLEEFASVVSHDLRNPLQTAQGTLHAAREDGDPAYFDRIERSLDRIERIVDDVLWLARAGEDIGTVEEISLPNAIDDAWEVVAADDTGVTLLVDERLHLIEADYDRFCQLLENVFSNAIEHGSTVADGRTDAATDETDAPDDDSAGRAVTVRAEAIPDGFAIEDDGPGVPPADRERIFERGVTSTPHGTGFGLHIVSVIAAAHGWTVTVTDGQHDDGTGTGLPGARFEFSGLRRE